MTTIYPTLAYQQLGEAGDPVVLLHGLFGSSKNLGVMARMLARSFRIYSIDLLNHGKSPHSQAMSIRLLADTVLHTLDVLKLPTTAVFGHSLGGKVAMYLALHYPQRVSRLAVGDIAPKAYPAHHTEILKAMQNLELAALQSRAEADKQLSTSIADQATRQFILQNLKKADVGYEWQLNLVAISANYNALREAVADRGGVSPYRGQALFISGSKSDYIQPDDLPLMQDLFPRMEHKVIAGAGHWLHAEKPQEFNGLLNEFLLR